MKNTMFGISSWFLSNPRRAFIILSVFVIVVTLAFASVPGGVVLAEDIVGGS